MGHEYQITGPPGTGKTTALARQASLAVDKHGPEGVVITSLTRAAAAEIAGRHSGVARDHVGTMHSLCHRSLRPTLVLDSPKGIKAWNEHVSHAGLNSTWRLSAGSAVDPNDPLDDKRDAAEVTRGDQLLDASASLRHRLINPDYWPPEVSRWYEAWWAFGQDIGATDFTGLIWHGLDLPKAPGVPTVLIGDEAQDWTPLEARVFRQWATACEISVLAADVDQCLYQWRAASPRLFLDSPVPPEQTRLLAQSYRVPRAVHAYAQRIIRRISDRVDVHYLPRDAEGHVRRDATATWAHPEYWLDRWLDREGDLMLLAPCAYQLRPALRWLRDRGIPFANRYRRKAGAWNPLAGGDQRKTAKAQLLAYLSGDAEGWDTDALALWVPLLRSVADGALGQVLVRGAKVALEDLTRPRPVGSEYLALWRAEADGLAALARAVPWLLERATAKDRRRLEYPAVVHHRGGVRALTEEPRLTIGTVHSVKGGEATHVAVLAALPPRWAENPNADELHRLFYVAATRARESLTLLCGDRGGYPC